MLRFDLHTHSTASDGKLTPEQLCEALADKALDVFALTDHDTIAGYQELKAKGLDSVVKHWVTGVESSCVALRQSVHIVALDFDDQHPKMLELLREQAEKRHVRGLSIARRLEKLGLPGLYDQALVYAGSADSIGRPHFARALVDAGCCKSEQQAFDRWLGNGKKGDVKIDWPDMASVIEVINLSGGVAVLAHPLRYKMTFTKIRQLIELFAEAKGTAIEVVGQQAKPDQLKHLVRVTAHWGLAASGGSDFHDPNWSWAPLGEVAELPKELPPVWSRFQRTVIDTNY